MQSQHLTSVAQNPISVSGDMEPGSEKVLHHRIADISNLIASLNDALMDLERTALPPLNDDFDFYSEVRRFETGLIKGALKLTGGSQVKAAKLLKLKTTTLNAKIRTLKLSPRGI
jgi:DNA-binding NtrC family response regulator